MQTGLDSQTSQKHTAWSAAKSSLTCKSLPDGQDRESEVSMQARAAHKAEICKTAELLTWLQHKFTIDWLPLGVIQLRDIWDGRALICGEFVTSIEQPDKATLQCNSCSGQSACAQVAVAAPLHKGEGFVAMTDCTSSVQVAMVHRAKLTNERA